VPKAVVLLFGSGKLVIAGSKKPRDAETAVGHIVKELEGMALI
jgi:transcription initiation factor TFIID TATA-box-binding protein